MSALANDETSSTRCISATCLLEVAVRPRGTPIVSSEVPSILTSCCCGVAESFASKPPRQIFDRIASPKVLRKVVIALYDARSKLRSFLEPAFSPQHQKQAASDDAAAFKLEDATIEL